MVIRFVYAKVELLNHYHPRLGPGQTVPANMLLKHGKCTFTDEDWWNDDDYYYQDVAGVPHTGIRGTDLYKNGADPCSETPPA